MTKLIRGLRKSGDRATLNDLVYVSFDSASRAAV